MYEGLVKGQVQELVQRYGYNEIPQKATPLLEKIGKNLASPIGVMLVAASFLSFFLGKTSDGYFILVLLVLNVGITLWQEYKADTAIKKLNKQLEQKVKTYRDRQWQHISSRLLVPGDIIQLGSGEIIPADGTLLEAHHVQVNESALTGESLPEEKKEKDAIFSGAFVTTGLGIIQIEATGTHTRFGKTLFSVERMRKQSLLEKDILRISTFLTVLSLLAVLLLSTIFLLKKVPLLELLTLDVSLIIAGIPVSLPTVMTLIIEFGVLQLAAKKVIVRRLSALADLANVNFLLTDKTGTLTQNKITVQEICVYDGFSQKDVLCFASLLALQDQDNPLNMAIADKAKDMRITFPKWQTRDFLPGDASRKRSTLHGEKEDGPFVISVGAPQVVASFCTMTKTLQAKVDGQVSSLAQKGYRTLAVAFSPTQKEAHMQLIGLIALSDTLREDAASVIFFLKEHGIGIAMVTGDHAAIAQNIATQLHLDDDVVVTKEQLAKVSWKTIDASLFTKTGAFAEILPEDKLQLVEKAKEFFVVAANGDGVNDLPALKAANVGIAVANAVTVLKATADIVLLSQGIRVIKDALIESRKIFARLYTYSLYRISESLRLIVTIVVLGALYQVYPLTALQIILIALLNDIPIISLASDRVHIPSRPAKIHAKKRFILSSLYGLTGIANSLILFFLVRNVLHLDWLTIQTMYFLKVTVSGHMLIYVAHTKKRWWKFLPSSQVIMATTLTQLVATGLALSGFLMPGKISLLAVIFVWVWSFFWMQVAELLKIVQNRE